MIQAVPIWFDDIQSNISWSASVSEADEFKDSPVIKLFNICSNTSWDEGIDPKDLIEESNDKLFSMKLIKCQDNILESIKNDDSLSVISESKESSSSHSNLKIYSSNISWDIIQNLKNNDPLNQNFVDIDNKLK